MPNESDGRQMPLKPELRPTSGAGSGRSASVGIDLDKSPAEIVAESGIVPPRTEPNRIVQVGRRRSDRAVAWLLALAMFLFMGSVVWTSFRLDRLTTRIETIPVCEVR